MNCRSAFFIFKLRKEYSKNYLRLPPPNDDDLLPPNDDRLLPNELDLELEPNDVVLGVLEVGVEVNDL